jgi:hypothetical protein
MFCPKCQNYRNTEVNFSLNDDDNGGGGSGGQ